MTLKDWIFFSTSSHFTDLLFWSCSSVTLNEFVQSIFVLFILFASLFGLFFYCLRVDKKAAELSESSKHRNGSFLEPVTVYPIISDFFGQEIGINWIHNRPVSELELPPIDASLDQLEPYLVTDLLPPLYELSQIADVRYGLLFILALSSLTVYGIIIAGWSSNSKYAFLGALRSSAQMISYEVSISLVILTVIVLAGSLNFTEIVNVQLQTCWFLFPLFPCAVIFFISMLAETNRTPFDLPEAEAELVAGYNVEYSSIIFAMFFLGEYSNMILMSVLSALLFLGGWGSSGFSGVLAFKALLFCVFFVLVRATFPRYRYDQLMNIGWKIFLLVATGYLLFLVGTLFAFDGLLEVSELALPLLILFTPEPLFAATVEGAEVASLLAFAGQVFFLGAAGMIFNFSNYLVSIMCSELMYLGAIISFIFLNKNQSAVYGLAILVLAACESAIGLGLLIAIYRFGRSISFVSYNRLGQ